MREVTEKEKSTSRVNVVIEGVLGRRVTHDNLIETYQNLHAWLHGVNIYVYQENSEFYEKRLVISMGKS